MRRPDALALLAHRRFAYFFAGQTVSTFGTAMSGIALTFAVLDLTGSASALGVVLAAHWIPMVVFMLVGGVVADRLSRSLVMQVSHIASAVTQGIVATLLLTGTAELWMLIVLEALNGAVAAFTFPAMTSIVPLVVPRDRIQQANAMLSFSRGSVVILGPSVGAALVVTVGSGWALAVDAGSYAIAAALMSQLRLPPATLGDGGERPSMVRDLRDGWSAFTSLTWVWVVVAAFGVLNMIQVGAWNMLGAVTAVDTIGKAQWGWVLSSEAAGLLAMTLVMMHVRLTYPVRAGMLGMTCVALPILVLGIDPETLPLMVLAFVAGAGTEVFSIGWQTAYHEHIPNEILSRVGSYDALGSFVAIPLGQLLYGPLISFFDAEHVLVTSAVVYVVIALSTLLSSSVRNLGRLDIAADASVPGGRVAE
jgi:MFS family permease